MAATMADLRKDPNGGVWIKAHDGLELYVKQWKVSPLVEAAIGRPVLTMTASIAWGRADAAGHASGGVGGLHPWVRSSRPPPRPRPSALVRQPSSLPLTWCPPGPCSTAEWASTSTATTTSLTRSCRPASP